MNLSLLNKSLLVVIVLCFIVCMYASWSLKYFFELTHVPVSKPAYISSVVEKPSESEHVIFQVESVQNLASDSKAGETTESLKEELRSRNETLLLPVSSIMLDKSSIYISENNSLPTSIFFIGNVQIQTRVAVFGCALPPQQSRYDLNYVFYLPLTVLAWQRISFSSIVVLTGTPSQWTEDPVLSFVVRCLRALNSMIIFIPCLSDNAIMLSQVSRLFVAGILPAEFDATYLVTSDSDLWPVDADSYRLVANKNILSLNADCCGTFDYQREKVKLLPMSAVGMSLVMWRDVLNISRQSVRSASDIIDYVSEEFGDVAREPVTKGENTGWYLDQHLISIRLHQWVQRHGSDAVDYVARSVGQDRIDRSWWTMSYDGGVRKIDAHLLEHGYRSENWRRLLPLIAWMFGDNGAQFQWFIDYHRNFLDLAFAHGHL